MKKTALDVLAKKFLGEKKIEIKLDSSWHSKLLIFKKVVDGSSVSCTDYQIERFLEAKINDFKQKWAVSEFMSWLLERGFKDEAVRFLINKTPSKVKDDLWDEYKSGLKDIIEFAKYNKSVLFSYINRVKVLEGIDCHFLEDVFLKLDSQIERKEIFLTLFKTKSFASIDKQSEYYQLFEKSIINKKELKSCFNLLDFSKENQSDIVLDSEFCALVFVVDFKKLLILKLKEALDAGVENKKTTEDYSNLLSFFARNINNNILNNLKVSDISTKISGGVFTCSVLCDYGNKEIVRCFFNDLLSLPLKMGDEVFDLRYAFDKASSTLYKVALVKVLKNTLEQNVGEEEMKSSPVRQKI